MKTAEEYRSQLQSLLPKGKLWTRNLDSWFAQFLYGLADGLVRIESRMYDLIGEAVPTGADELLTDYETEFGLPEDYTALAETVLERQADIRRKLTTIGQNNPAYYIDRAVSLGYDIVIEEFKFFLAGISVAGDRCSSNDSTGYFRILADIGGDFGGFSTGFTHISFDSTHKDNIDYTISQVRNLNLLIEYFLKYRLAHLIPLFDFYNVGFNRGFSWGFKSTPHHDGSIPFIGHDAGFSDGFNSPGHYDGTYLTGAFSTGFTIGMDAHVGNGFKKDGFGTGFSIDQ